MFAINHAATALVLKARYPEAPMGWLLVSVQLVELLWLGLAFAGLERFGYMPYSHSVVSGALIALIAWLLVGRLFRRKVLGAGVAVGILSHTVLDIFTQTHYLPLVPLLAEPRLGLGLYGMPLAAFAVEMTYALLCWVVFRGGTALLAILVLFNLASMALFVTIDPQALFAGDAARLACAMAAQIALALFLVWSFSRRRAADLEHPYTRLARSFAWR